MEDREGRGVERYGVWMEDREGRGVERYGVWMEDREGRGVERYGVVLLKAEYCWLDCIYCLPAVVIGLVDGPSMLFVSVTVAGEVERTYFLY